MIYLHSKLAFIALTVLCLFHSLIPIATAENTKQGPQAIVFLIDKSKSMGQEQKLYYVRETLQKIIHELSDNDELAIIGFDHAPFILISMRPVSQAKSIIDSRMRALYPTGRTNLAPSLVVAKQELAKSSSDYRRVFIITDGMIPEKKSVTHSIDQLIKEGIEISTMSIGKDSDGLFLKEIASKGKGTFYHVNDSEKIPKMLGEEFTFSGDIPKAPSKPTTLAKQPTGSLRGVLREIANTNDHKLMIYADITKKRSKAPKRGSLKKMLQALAAEHQLSWTSHDSMLRIFNRGQEKSIRNLPKPKEYTGRKVSLDLNRTASRNALRIIEEVCDCEIMNPDVIKEDKQIDLLLLDTPWDQVLSYILEFHDYGFERKGSDILLVR